MQITTKKVEQILDLLDELHESHERKQKVYEEFVEEFTYDSYVILRNDITYLLDFIKIAYGEDIKDEFDYYYFEAKNMTKAEVVDKEKREYDFTKKADIIRYFKNNYNA